jgi:hypothetical protein
VPPELPLEPVELLLVLPPVADVVELPLLEYGPPKVADAPPEVVPLPLLLLPLVVGELSPLDVAPPDDCVELPPLLVVEEPPEVVVPPVVVAPVLDPVVAALPLGPNSVP